MEYLPAECQYQFSLLLCVPFLVKAGPVRMSHHPKGRVEILMPDGNWGTVCGEFWWFPPLLFPSCSIDRLRHCVFAKKMSKIYRLKKSDVFGRFCVRTDI